MKIGSGSRRSADSIRAILQLHDTGRRLPTSGTIFRRSPVADKFVPAAADSVEFPYTFVAPPVPGDTHVP